jgi:catechol 2,3-dioxygenase-like lactoylglutathione lyase family enzyme
MRFTVDRIDHVVLNTKDIEVTASWYQRVLGMDREEFGEDRRTALKFGGQKINLRPVTASDTLWASGKITEAGAMDICFMAAVAAEDILRHLQECGITIEAGPVGRTGALGAMTSVYCRDPDGNLVEIASYLR